MAGKKVVPDIDEQEAIDCMQRLAVAKAEVRKLELMLKHYAESNGGFSHAGLHLYTTQTIKETYKPSIIAEALTDIGVQYKDIINYFPATLINKLVRASEYGEDLRAYLKKEPAEGMILVYGKPLTAARTSPPDESKVRVLKPGDEPLETEQMDEAEGGYEDFDDLEDAPLSPGD